MNTRTKLSIAGSGTTEFHRDGVSVTAPVISETFGYSNGSPTRKDVTPGISERFGSAAPKYMHGGLKDISAWTDPSQAVVETSRYDAFGNTLPGSTGSFNRSGYGGKFGYQSDGNVQLLGHRYYDSETGTFITRDPIKDGRNWYSYCDNNPVIRVDANGLDWHNPGIVYVDPKFKGTVTAVGEPGRGKPQVMVGIPSGFNSSPRMDVDILLVKGKDGKTHVYFLMGKGFLTGLSGSILCGKWDDESPDIFHVDADGNVSGPGVIYLGTLEDVYGDPVLSPIWGKGIKGAEERRVPRSVFPERSPCFVPGKEPWKF